MAETGSGAARDSITFLGTGGARFIIVSQVLATGGLWFNLDGTDFLMDPGPGCIVRVTDRKLNPERLEGIIVSHRHLDHAADVNIMTEAMTGVGARGHGHLFAPRDALETEPVILDYLKKRLESVEALEPGRTYALGNVMFTAPVRHVHGVENYGLVFRTAKYTVSYITDTRYFEGLASHYGGDLLLLNVVFLDPKTPAQSIQTNMPIDHLSVPDVERLVKEIRPKTAIMTHFGMGMYRAGPSTVAERVTQNTGIRVLAAYDGMEFHLSELDSR